MANIQPFDYQESTNIEEHNQIVNKVNEIVEVINNVNLDTINSEIANLKANATATDTEIANIKNKDTQQDTEIDGITKNLVSNVTATFDNPSRELKISLGREASPSIDATVVIPASSETGQYSAGNGITIDNYQIAVDTNVVALKTDIPVVPDVTEINSRLDTIDGEITGINTDITNLTNKNTEQDTAINGKVAIAQGIENAGKVLGIGVDGNVTPVDAGGSSGGEVWEEVSTNNWPTDWNDKDKIKVEFIKRLDISSPSSWTTELIAQPFTWSTVSGLIIKSFIVDISSAGLDYITIGSTYKNTYAEVVNLNNHESYANFNGGSEMFKISINSFNGVSSRQHTYTAVKTDIGDYFKLYRLKQ